MTEKSRSLLDGLFWPKKIVYMKINKDFSGFSPRMSCDSKKCAARECVRRSDLHSVSQEALSMEKLLKTCLDTL